MWCVSPLYDTLRGVCLCPTSSVRRCADCVFQRVCCTALLPAFEPILRVCLPQLHQCRALPLMFLHPLLQGAALGTPQGDARAGSGGGNGGNFADEEALHPKSRAARRGPMDEMRQLVSGLLIDC